MLYADLSALRAHRAIPEDELSEMRRMQTILERPDIAGTAPPADPLFLAERLGFLERQRRAILRRIQFLDTAEEKLANLAKSSGEKLDDALRRL